VLDQWFLFRVMLRDVTREIRSNPVCVSPVASCRLMARDAKITVCVNTP
jgi:hypothetical protein